MPTTIITLPCSAQELETALHRICDHDGLWHRQIAVCLHNPENIYSLELSETENLSLQF